MSFSIDQSLTYHHQVIDQILRIADIIVVSSRSPVGPNRSSDTDLGLVSSSSGEREGTVFTPEYRVKQVHWRHFLRLIYKWTIDNIHRQHLLLSIVHTRLS